MLKHKEKNYTKKKNKIHARKSGWLATAKEKLFLC